VTRSRIRFWVIIALACVAVGLFAASHLVRASDSSAGQRVRAGVERKGSLTVAECVNAIVSEFDIPRSAVRVIPAQQAGGIQEVRLRVDPGFSRYEFHSALAGALADLDASVVGTESMKTKTISLQIIKDGAQVMLVTLDLRPLPQQQRKESRH
jgi:hypothetical protein